MSVFYLQIDGNEATALIVFSAYDTNAIFLLDFP